MCLTEALPLNKAQNEHYSQRVFIFPADSFGQDEHHRPSFLGYSLVILPFYYGEGAPQRTFVAIPSKALTIIQKMAPGPLTHSAVGDPGDVFPIPDKQGC